MEYFCNNGIAIQQKVKILWEAEIYRHICNGRGLCVATPFNWNKSGHYLYVISHYYLNEQGQKYP